MVNSPKGFTIRKKVFPLTGRACANGAKNAGFSKWYKFVNAYVERDKKNLKKVLYKHINSLLARKGVPRQPALGYRP